MELPTTTCPGCGRAVAAKGGACLYCGAALPAPGTAPPAVKPRPALLCQTHPDVAAVGRCFRCRKGLCETCAFKITVGWACADCVTAAAQETSRKGRSMAITSILLGAASVGVFVVLVVVAAGVEYTKEFEIIDRVVTLLSVGLAIAGLSCGFISKDRSRRMSGPALAGVIISGVTLALLILAMVANAFMKQ